MAWVKRVGAGVSEAAFQKAFFRAWKENGFWHDRIHPASGAQVGQPDALLMVDGLVIPTEFKIGRFENGGVSFSTVRPRQIAWHRKFKRFGGQSRFVCGVATETGWTPVILDFETVCSGARKAGYVELTSPKGLAFLA